MANIKKTSVKPNPPANANKRPPRYEPWLSYLMLALGWAMVLAAPVF